MNEFKLSTKGLDDLFSTQQQRDEEKLSKIRDIPIEQIDDFPNHPYRVEDNEDMQALVQSIKERGVITPATVIAKPDGRYTLVSGHRRKHASTLAGLTTLRCEVMDLTEDEATVLMVDSNLHREKILPSEKAFAYKMKLDAIKRQGQRTDLTSGPVGQKLSRDEIAENAQDSARQIQRYIRLTELTPELLTLTDEGKLKFQAAVELSYLNREAQGDLTEAMREADKVPSLAQAKQIRSADSEGRLTGELLAEILSPTKQKAKSRIDTEKLRQYIPAAVPDEAAEDYILKALQYYSEHHVIIDN